MAFAGETITAGKIPGERIATATFSTDSADFTGETQIDSVTAFLVSGRTYRVRYYANFGAAVNAAVTVRIIQDTIAGAEVVGGNGTISSASGIGFVIMIEGEYTATATGNKTFVTSGTSTATTHAEGAGNRVRILSVDYAYGP